MDNNKSQQMQNWKKLLIMDPLLNNLFNQSLEIKDFIHQKILTQQHQQIIHTYSKLSSVKHALSKKLQKQVEAKHQIIEQTFLSKHKMTNSLSLKNQNQNQIAKNMKTLQNFNQNFKKVQQNTIKLENVNKILKFAKALQKFKIDCRLLKTFMKDYTNNQNKKQDPNNKRNDLKNTTQLTQSLNLPKISKLIKEIIELIEKNDFSGIKYYESQKQNIQNAKAILLQLTQKQLLKRIKKFRQFLEKYLQNPTQINNFNDNLKTHEDDIIEKIKVLQCLNKVRQVILGSIFKKSLSIISEILKKLFNKPSIDQFKDYFLSTVSVELLTTFMLYIRLEQILSTMIISQDLTMSGVTMFVRYTERVKDYFKQLINWTIQQNNKENQKIYANSQKIIQSLSHTETLILNEMQQISTKSNVSSVKCSLILKYPTLLTLTIHLINRVHQQVLLHGEYNQNRYDFAEKKESIILAFQPLSRKFHEIINFFTNDKYFDQMQIKSRANLLSLIHNSLLGNLRENQFFSEYTSPLIEDLNQGTLVFIEKRINNNNNFFQMNELSSLMKLCSEPKLLQSYSSLETLIKHLLKIKTISNSLFYQDNIQ